MSWFGKKKANPEDGDFPHVSRHYREERAPTRIAKIIPPLQWNGVTTVILGIDIGSMNTTMSFAYLQAGHDVEVHNIIYWPKEFPLRESDTDGLPLPDMKAGKTFKEREAYTSVGFVSHPTWSSEKTATYLYTTNYATSPPAFQARTEFPFIESAERYKFHDLVQHLLKHALGVYGAVIKPTQPHWPQLSDVVITLPSGLPKSAEMTVSTILNRTIHATMPKVIGQTRIFYVRKPDVRLFEDDLWRNIDTALCHDDTFLLVDWNMTSGDMLCASYKGIQLESGHMAFGIRLRSYMQALPANGKRDGALDAKEAVRFANALHWCAQNKHRTQKLLIRILNPMKKPENLLELFHKSLTDQKLQVGLRPINSATETGAFGAVNWRIAHIIAQSQSIEGDNLSLIQDMTQTSAREVDADAQQPSPITTELPPSSRISRAFSTISTGIFGIGDRQSVGGPPLLAGGSEPPLAQFMSASMTRSSKDYLSSPVSPQLPLTPTVATESSPNAVVVVHTPIDSPKLPNLFDTSQTGMSDSDMLPPAYTDSPKLGGVVHQDIGPSRIDSKNLGHQALAGWNYEAREDNEISFVEGDFISNIEIVHKDWWRGTNSRGQTGVFPANYVRPIQASPT